jgi:hypothetical protein
MVRVGAKLFLALALLSWTVISVQAQRPEKTEAFVYGGHVFNGHSHINTFYPPSVETIYLLANRPSVLLPRRTLVYFWPLTNLYKADWASLNAAVGGTLEVVVGDEVVAAIPQESTLAGQGSVVNLPPGRYAVHLRTDDGRIAPGSEKKLVVFAPRRQGLGYQIVPQEGWTHPERSDGPADVIYARRGTVLYLQPYVEEAHNDLYYTRLEEPQSRLGRRDRWRWVYVRPFEEAGRLTLDYGHQTVEVLAQPYRIEPLPGSVVQYKVVAYDPATDTRPPDFVAYQLVVDANHASYRLRLQDTEGKAVLGSERQVRRVPEINSWALYFLAGLPLTVGVFVIVSRRDRLAIGRRTMSLEEE